MFTVNGEGAVAGSLPAEVTTYVGRRAELAEVRRLLTSACLVTLTGPGGVGKTRLATRLASESEDAFLDGTVFVGLAELRDPTLLVSTVATSLGLGDRSARPGLDLLIDALRPLKLLLVLDNCEHMVDACARFVAAVLANCPDVVVLATSRQSLGVPGERVVPVGPLAVPEPGVPPARLMNYDAVRLLRDRATAVVPSFQITDDNIEDVARLTRALDGLPLALELAAVRLRVLSVGQLVDRLDHRLNLLSGGNRRGPSRHETLTALIDWSHELCTEPERLLWARASVFSGGFDLDAAEEVCSGSGLDRHAVLDVIDGLLDKSILLREEHRGVARYRMLEMVRQYGENHLRAAGELVWLRRRHRDWYLELAKRCEADWFGPRQVEWIERLRREHANLRVALEFCAGDADEAVVGLRMMFAIKEYWIVRGFNTEGRMHTDKLVRAAPDAAPYAAHSLWIHGFFALVQGDLPAYERTLAEAARIAEDTDDDKARAYVNHVRAYAALIGNDMPRAVELFGAASEMFARQRDPGAQLWSRFNYGLALSLADGLAPGRQVLIECVDIYTKRGEVFWRAWALWSRGAAEYLHGDIAESRAACLEVLRMQRRLGDQVILAFCLTVLSGCAAHSGEYPKAARLLGAATTVWQWLGASPMSYGAFVEPIQRDIGMVTKELGPEAAAEAFLEGTALSTEEATLYALGEASRPEGAAQPVEHPLTKREAEIAGLVAKGLTNREIAAKLVIAQRTAESHVDHILTKLGFTNRAQIAAWVVETRAV
ncbi:ATP-binding protein [Actinokineospora iranica]|uniref:Non-specific serine/threonine protein kinase n=1 Tax=Actinokineospora iranica TaxID=1271860 RepID=A0A1G6LEL9_9PSEU|nr:LuxR C-terminal-related transcriptional regulator [Actinokineospora iranica]SDC41215.1 non-specific serine/threonine protein kinase [Actinokineospora iranica]